MADEEALAVVVAVDEPAGDVVSGSRADLAGRWVVDVDASDFDLELVADAADVDVGLAEDHEQVAGAGLFQEVAAHCEIRIHPRQEDAEAPEPALLGGDSEAVDGRRELAGRLTRVRVEREAAHDE